MKKYTLAMMMMRSTKKDLDQNSSLQATCFVGYYGMLCYVLIASVMECINNRFLAVSNN